MWGIISEAMKEGYLAIFLVSVLELSVPIFYWVVLYPGLKEGEDD